MTTRTRDVFIIIDRHTGNVYGSRFYASEAHAIMAIQDMGMRYNPMADAIMPARLIYKTDRDENDLLERK